MGDPSSFYLGLWRWAGSQRENIFTECLASALRADRALCNAWLRKLGCKPTGSVRVSTQVRRVRDFHDLELWFGPHCVCVEHKLESPLGSRQLERYLGEPGIIRVALISRRDQAVPRAATRSKRYLSPGLPHRKHFYWSDFYGIVAKRASYPGASTLTQELAALMKHLGFDPPLAGLEMNSSDPLVYKRARSQFCEYWKPVVGWLDSIGWTNRAKGSIAQIYVHPDRGPVKRLLLDPLDHGSLKVRFDPRNQRVGRLIPEALAGLTGSFMQRADISTDSVTRATGKAPVIDVRISLRLLFDGVTSPVSRAGRLDAFIRPLVSAVRDL